MDTLQPNAEFLNQDQIIGDRSPEAISQETKKLKSTKTGLESIRGLGVRKGKRAMEN